MLKVWAQPLSYFKGVVNHETPLQACHQREDHIDKLLIANGQRIMTEPLELRCDPTTQITIRDIEFKEMRAYKAQDYEQLKSLSRDLRIVRSVRNLNILGLLPSSCL